VVIGVFYQNNKVKNGAKTVKKGKDTKTDFLYKDAL